MFVLNCKVDFGKTLRYPQNSKQKCKSKSSLKDETMEKDEDTYHPVFCSICNTQVAVRDTDEVYHFFNVLASFA